jgi:2,3-bisphosphoglycerate-independent phosphoglycerate mutase
MITDGRDTPPRSAAEYLGALEHALGEAGGHIATVSGRYYAMDRDNRWERIEMAWQAVVEGRGRKAESARDAIRIAYERTEDDEFIAPTCIEGGARIEEGDSVIFFNYRKDRPKQIVRSLFQKDFNEFERGSFQSAEVTCLMEYDSAFGLPFAFEHEAPAITLCQVLSDARLPHFHCAETEKYAHVTFFFNGGRSEPMPHEVRELIPSPKVPTYDMQPEMSAPGVADAVIKALHSKDYPFIVVNFANGDMVGHTAVRESVIQAVEVLDEQVGRVMDAAVAEGYSVILTADHGNCDEMVDPVTGSPHTQHTLYPVPCLIIDKIPWRLSIGAGIDRIAPTVLALMGIPKPAAMPTESLLLMPDGGEMVA